MADTPQERPEESSGTASSIGCLVLSVMLFVLVIAAGVVVAWLNSSGGSGNP